MLMSTLEDGEDQLGEHDFLFPFMLWLSLGRLHEGRQNVNDAKKGYDAHPTQPFSLPACKWATTPLCKEYSLEKVVGLTGFVIIHVFIASFSPAQGERNQMVDTKFTRPVNEMPMSSSILELRIHEDGATQNECRRSHSKSSWDAIKRSSLFIRWLNGMQLIRLHELQRSNL